MKPIAGPYPPVPNSVGLGGDPGIGVGDKPPVNFENYCFIARGFQGTQASRRACCGGGDYWAYQGWTETMLGGVLLVLGLRLESWPSTAGMDKMLRIYC